MTRSRIMTGLSATAWASIFVLMLTGCAALAPQPAGNSAVPEPRRSVDLARYAGLWFEQGRYEAAFQRGCEGVTARYAPLPTGEIEVINTCREGAIDGPGRSITGRARVVEGSGNAKLKVSFLGPFFLGDYWVLDHSPAQGWSVVGEPSGRYLWLLTRQPRISEARYAELRARAAALGYDVTRLRRTQQSGEAP